MTRRQLLTTVGDVQVITTEPLPASHPFASMMRNHETMIEGHGTNDIVGYYDSWEAASAAHRACVFALRFALPFIDADSVKIETRNLEVHN